MRKITFLLLTLMLCFVSKISSQFTIGSLIEPERAALLEVKNKKAVDPASVTDNKNVTVDAAGGGIRLPRVYLKDRYTLDPFIPENDLDWSSNKDKIKERHAGLMVYNINVSSLLESPNKILRQGVYIWNGSQWKEALFGKESFFYLPAFPMSLTLGVNTPIDLYEEVYKKQFLSVSGRLYARDELDFVVTYYDKTVLQIDNLNADNKAGKMAYTVVGKPDNSPVLDVLINVVLVVK
jgi:hypothetical protein